VIACGLLRDLFGSAGNLGGTVPGRGFSAAAAAVVAILTLGLVTVILGTASGARNVGHNAAIAVGGYVTLAGAGLGDVADDGEGEGAGRGRHRAEADLDRERGPVFA
jgi:hypothetical protein